MYQLGNVILPNPKKFTRNIIESAIEHLLLLGKTTKRTTNRKEQFVLEYQYLTPTQMNSILSQYELDQVLTFTVNETNLSIPATDVLMDISGLEYPQTAGLYRENMIITLTEVR
jgi:hypothetical protein